MMSPKPKLNVTGLSGLLGSSVRRRAQEEFDLINIDITEGVDITDPSALHRALEPHGDAEALLHLAAMTDVSRANEESGDEQGLVYRVNVLGARNVARACDALGLHLIAVSTDFVFSGEKSGPYCETDTPDPIEWYGRTKMLGEEAVRESKSWTLARIAFPYVAGEATRPDLIRSIRAKLASGDRAKLFTDQVITPTYVGDIIEAALLLIRTRPAGELFHVVGSTSLSPFHLGRTIAETFGFNPDLVEPSLLEDYLKNDPRPRQRALALSNEKWTRFAQAHDLAPPLTLAQGLDRVRDAMGEE
jgi:dTDP-4-dehydrorhamnose reductase